MSGNGKVAGDGGADPLLRVLLELREAFAPFGIAFPGALIGLWRGLQAQGLYPFTGSGEFDPAAVARLDQVIALMRASTADIPTPHPDV